MTLCIQRGRRLAVLGLHLLSSAGKSQPTGLRGQPHQKCIRSAVPSHCVTLWGLQRAVPGSRSLFLTARTVQCPASVSGAQAQESICPIFNWTSPEAETSYKLHVLLGECGGGALCA